MVQCCFTSTETVRLIRTGSPGRPPRLSHSSRKVWEEGGRVYTYRYTVTTRVRESIYLSLHCHHQIDSCIKMGSDASHFNVSLIVRDKVTRRCRSQTTTFLKRRESRSGIEPRPFCSPALLLGQTGSPVHSYHRVAII